MVLKQRLQAINKTEILILFLILCIGVFLRFSGLGYSHFYGDETKTLYLNKTIPAIKFLLDQRKGPVQYIAAWTVEKITNSYNEFFIRTPFAIAGIFSVLVFYFLVKKFFNWKESLISTFLFCVSGFSIAFSRTAQYQSFLILFGLLSIYFFISALENKKRSWYLLSSLTLAASFYSHYDAIFFLVPIIYIFFNQSDRNYKEIILFFAAPCAAVLSLFYLPYIFGGYLFSNTVNYVARRINGSEYGSNSYSFYTFWIYNPLFLHFFNITLSLLYILFIKPKDKIRDLFLYWFLIPFIFFNGVIANPGTHIHNYFIPLYMVSGPSILWIFSLVKNKILRYLTSLILLSMALIILAIQGFVYIPHLNNGYPWKESKLGMLTLKPANKSSYHLYLYGFPYNRGWDQIKDYMYSINGVRGFYTNDSSVMSKYYLLKYDYTPKGSNFLPQYYIDVVDSAEFVKTDGKFLENYSMEKEINVNGDLTATVYKLTPRLPKKPVTECICP